MCPSISLSLIKRILCNFTPDEFCPDPVPGTVLESLNAEVKIDISGSKTFMLGSLSQRTPLARFELLGFDVF